MNIFNPLDSKGSYSATSNKTKLVHWPLMGGWIWYSEEGTSVNLGKEVFTDLDFAGDVSLLAEMLEAFVLALTVMQEEAFYF